MSEQENSIDQQKTQKAKTTKSQPAKKPSKPKSVVAEAKETTRKVTKKAKEVAEHTVNGAARVVKAAQEFSEDVAPVAERAKETTRKVTKKVKEELGPAAEKAGKGLSAAFKATARATRKSAIILGIKASISTEIRKRQRLYTRLGESYFRAQKKKTPTKGDQEALKSLVADIKMINAEIQSLEMKEKVTRGSP